MSENVQTQDQCQRPGCECPRGAGSDYCGPACENAATGGMDTECDCEHPECG